MLFHRFQTGRIFLAVLVLIVSSAFSALADPFKDAILKFSNGSFADSMEAVETVAASGNTKAYSIISALQDSRLFVDPDTKSVYIKTADGKYLDAATGQLVAGMPQNAGAVRLNNKLRRYVEASLAGLTLLSPDPAMRIQAAQSIFRSHDPAVLSTVESAMDKETNASVKSAFADAKAAIILSKIDSTDAEKLDAISAMSGRGDQDALALLNDPDGAIGKIGSREGGRNRLNQE